jgi:hypothetical protein
MHTSRAVAGVFLLAVSITDSLAAQGFEGAITIRMPGRQGAPPQEMEYLSRGGNVRVNVNSPAGSMSILGLQAESKTYMLMEAQRMYMEVPPESVSAALSKADEPKVTKTGRKETIAGESCEHIMIETNGANGPSKTDVCMAYGVGPFVNPMANMARMTAWQRQLIKEGGFPLRVTLGDGSVPIEVTKIEKKRLSENLFRIPADFSKMDMPRRP